MLEPCRALIWFAAHAQDSLPDESRLAALQAKPHLGDVGREVARLFDRGAWWNGFTELLGLHYWLKRIAFTLTLAPPDGDQLGMRSVGGKFTWKLNDWQAARIAERIETLLPTENKSGSEILEVGSEGEIPVKVSRGEFTDDFLASVRP